MKISTTKLGLRWATALILLACGLAWVEAARRPLATPPPSGKPVQLGKLDAFWRYSAALGPFLEQGQALIQIPDDLTSGDFAYHKRPYPLEVPFADHLSIVRLLGGYNDGTPAATPRARRPGKAAPQLDPAVRERDLVYRGEDGKIHTRLELLRPRLQPYLDQGYTSFTLVLDNIPWCFPLAPHNGTYGQCAAPRDPAEWGAFIKALCGELVRIMGPERAGRLRFRVGTEANGRERFDGSLQEFFQHYDAAARAIREVLPTAQVGPFNVSGASLRGLEQLHNVGFYKLAGHCLEAGVPLDWMAYSLYYRPGEDFLSRVRTCRELWEALEQRYPQTVGISREIHEFGIAPFGEAAKGQFVSAEPGALGAALTCQMTFRLREAGIRRLWHWGVADHIPGAPVELFTGQGWFYSVAEAMVGGNAWILPGEAPSAAGTQHLAVGSFKDGHALLLISAYNQDVARHDAETMSFHLPAELAGGLGRTVRYVRLNRQTAPHDRIRADLAQAGLLKPEFVSRPDRLGLVREMGTARDAFRYVNAHLEEYRRMWRESLRLKPLEAGVGTVEPDGQGLKVSVRLAPPEILALEIR